MADLFVSGIEAIQRPACAVVPPRAVPSDREPL
jgi:hypothetical protein